MINFLSVYNLLLGSGIAVPESITTSNLAVPVFLILNQKLDHHYLKFFSSALPAHSTAQNDIRFPEEKLYRTDKHYRCSQSGNTGRSLSDRYLKWRHRSFLSSNEDLASVFCHQGCRGGQPLSSGLHMDN